ncbi:hypothetical protein L9F63_023460, partial [Diploptera punctata]
NLFHKTILQCLSNVTVKQINMIFERLTDPTTGLRIPWAHSRYRHQFRPSYFHFLAFFSTTLNLSKHNISKRFNTSSNKIYNVMWESYTAGDICMK